MVEFSKSKSKEVDERTTKNRVDSLVDSISDSVYTDWYNRHKNWSKDRPSRELKDLKRKLSNALKKNVKAEKSFTKNLERDFRGWKNNLNQKIDSYYSEQPEKEGPFLTQNNIDSFIEKYQNHRYINALDKQEFCDLFQENSPPIGEDVEESSNKVMPYQPILNCESQLEQCASELGFEGFRSSSAINDRDIANENYAACKTDLANFNKKLESKQSEIEQLKRKMQADQSDIRRLEEKQLNWTRDCYHLLRGDILEFLLELVVWPYATYYHDSKFHKALKKANIHLGPQYRLGLTFAVSFLWIKTIQTSVIIVTQNKSKEIPREGSKEIPRGGFKDIPRGGSLEIEEYIFDPICTQICIQIHLIKISDQLESLSLRSRITRKLKKIRTKISDHRIQILIGVMVTLYLGGLIPSQSYSINSISTEHSRISQDPTYLSEWKESDKTQNIEINSSISETLVEPESGTRLKVSSRTVKRKFRTKKKRVGKLSDFSNFEFENAEIIKSNPEKTKIRIREQ